MGEAPVLEPTKLDSNPLWHQKGSQLLLGTTLPDTITQSPISRRELDNRESSPGWVMGYLETVKYTTALLFRKTESAFPENGSSRWTVRVRDANTLCRSGSLRRHNAESLVGSWRSSPQRADHPVGEQKPFHININNIRTEMINRRRSDMGSRGRRKYFKKNLKKAHKLSLEDSKVCTYGSGVKAGVKAFQAERNSDAKVGCSKKPSSDHCWQQRVESQCGAARPESLGAEPRSLDMGGRGTQNFFRRERAPQTPSSIWQTWHESISLW